MTSPEHPLNIPDDPLMPPKGADDASSALTESHEQRVPIDTSNITESPPFASMTTEKIVDTSTDYSSENTAPSPKDATDKTDNLVSQRQFCWWRDLSENGQKFYRCLIHERGDVKELPKLAEMEGFSLDAALDELRNFNLLDENRPTIIKLSRRKDR